MIRYIVIDNVHTVVMCLVNVVKEYVIVHTDAY